MIQNISKVAIVGSGTLGARIGLQSALSGYQVTLYDNNPKAFIRAEKQFERIGKLLVKRGIYAPDHIKESHERISTTENLSKALENADFVSESVIEDIPIKKKVWSEISNLVDSECVLTTNTSYLLPSMFAQECGYPENFCAFHFHDVFTARVVDIMPHSGTKDEILGILCALGKDLNQIPVMIHKETPGYIFNKLFCVNLLTSGIMLAEGIASVEDIDKSWMGNYGTKIGPFGMIDEVGLDTLFHVGNNLEFPNKQSFLELVKNMIKEGKLGVKSGQGFYSYPNPSYKNPGFMK